MRFKIHILTILVGALSVLSFYLVFVVPAPVMSSEMLGIGPEIAKGTLNSQTAKRRGHSIKRRHQLRVTLFERLNDAG